MLSYQFIKEIECYIGWRIVSEWSFAAQVVMIDEWSAARCVEAIYFRNFGYLISISNNNYSEPKSLANSMFLKRLSTLLLKGLLDSSLKPLVLDIRLFGSTTTLTETVVDYGRTTATIKRRFKRSCKIYISVAMQKTFILITQNDPSRLRL